MSTSRDYWNDRREHERDIKMGIARCNNCGRKSGESKKGAHLQYCKKCKRVFKTPKYMLNEEEKDG